MDFRLELHNRDFAYQFSGEDRLMQRGHATTGYGRVNHSRKRQALQQPVGVLLSLLFSVLRVSRASLDAGRAYLFYNVLPTPSLMCRRFVARFIYSRCHCKRPVRRQPRADLIGQVFHRTESTTHSSSSSTMPMVSLPT